MLTRIPKWWKNKLKTFTTNTNCILVGNSINVNNKVLNIEKIKCKDFYWHLINKASHMPSNILKWCQTYPDFKNADPKTWQRIFKLPFQVIRETRIQTFQYKILHRVISCNKWLENICNLQLRNCPILEECLIFGFPECNTVVKGKNVCHKFLYSRYQILYIHSKII